MTPEQTAMLVHVVILLIVAITGAVQAWTAWRTSKLPTRQEDLKIAEELAKTVKENGINKQSPQ